MLNFIKDNDCLIDTNLSKFTTIKFKHAQISVDMLDEIVDNKK